MQFGRTVILPLSLPTVGEVSATTAGLLLAPQGIGATARIAVAGRRVDRFGGGRVAVGGLVLLALGTAPLLFVGGETPARVVALVLLVRGWGMGGALVPSMAAAYMQPRTDDIADATPQLNVLQRLGGAIGATVLTLALASGLPDAGATPEQAAAAFHFTITWAPTIAVLALVAAFALVRIDRRRRPDDAGGRHTADDEVVAA